MSHSNSPPATTLTSADPNAHFSAELIAVWMKGGFTKVAVAFLTAGGVEFFERECLANQNANSCSLYFAVQWPTNLDAVARLSPLLGDNLRIHLGAKTPVELGTDITPMLHSKVVYVEHEDGACTVFIGSHNWTGNALNGLNSEASVKVECGKSDDFASDVRDHLATAAKQCVRFNPDDLAFYKAVQHSLSQKRPHALDAAEVRQFELVPGSPAVVIHAEGDEQAVATGKLMLYLPVKSREMGKWFSTTVPTTIYLFVYPSGTLFGTLPTPAIPVLFYGPVGTNNDVAVSPSRQQDVTHEIRDLNHPVIAAVSDGNIPSVTNEAYQVVAELRRIGPCELPVFHNGSHPVLEVDAQFDELASGPTFATFRHKHSTEYERHEIVGHYDSSSLSFDGFVLRQPTPLKIIRLKVPGRQLYPNDLEQVVRLRLGAEANFHDFGIDIRPIKVHSTFVYQVKFVLRDEHNSQ